MMRFTEVDEDGSRHLSAWADLVITVVVTVCAVALIRSFVVDTYEVPTGSMLETIQLHDCILGEKLSYRFRSPQAGEVVTFDDPEEPSIVLVKRVIATEGQIVDIRNGNLYIDGKLQDEPYTSGRPTEPIARHASNLAADISYPHTVAKGCVWLMGDNRTDSLDSRYFGDVPVSTVSSHALLIYWPIDHAGAL